FRQPLFKSFAGITAGDEVRDGEVVLVAGLDEHELGHVARGEPPEDAVPRAGGGEDGEDDGPDADAARLPPRPPAGPGGGLAGGSLLPVLAADRLAAGASAATLPCFAVRHWVTSRLRHADRRRVSADAVRGEPGERFRVLTNVIMRVQDPIADNFPVFCL